tara:strand:+ start:653 stop:814 length:162 start_codon:yes stop_codon:yes gene_type:complete
MKMTVRELLERYAWLVNAKNANPEDWGPWAEYVDEMHRIETRFIGALGGKEMI